MSRSTRRAARNALLRCVFFFSSRRRHTRCSRDWSSDVCSSDLGMSSTIKELLLSAEYIASHGNDQIILCERGIRTFETATRNTLDLAAVPLLNELSHLPVVVDPSHATGRRSLVRPAAKAAVAVGADGLIIEVHPRPQEAWSDGPQSLTPLMFEEIMKELRPYIHLESRYLD